ncbi:MAG: hypothetical protein R3A10_09340 [Caldilineaceae bacterium]
MLRRFVALQLAAPPASAPGDAHGSRALALLLDETPGRDLAHFCRTDLPRLLQHLHHAPRGAHRVAWARRGRIRWPATIQSATAASTTRPASSAAKCVTSSTRPRTNSWSRSWTCWMPRARRPRLAA